MSNPTSRRPAPATLADDFDLQKYMTNINSDDPLRIVLSGHLYIEAALTALIECVLPFPDDLPVSKESFERKIRLAMALGVLHPTEAAGYRALNELRNDLAHTVPPHVTVGQTERLVDQLSKLQKTAIEGGIADHVIRPGRDLQPVLVGLFVILQSRYNTAPEPKALSLTTWRARLEG